MLGNFIDTGILRGVSAGQCDAMAACRIILFEHTIDCGGGSLFCKSGRTSHLPKSPRINLFFAKIPETPLWLLSKNRDEEAMKSLQWLRGWVSPKAVEDEFQALKRYNESSNACINCAKEKIPCPHPPPTIQEKLNDLLRMRVLKPALLTLLLFVFVQFTGFPSMRPFLVVIMNAYRVPMGGNWATVSLRLFQFAIKFLYIRVF